MELSIVIPVKDDIKITECINSIDEDVEVVVAMNDPSDEIIDIVNKLGVKSVHLPEANLSKAYNAGIEAATYDKVLLMDSDCVFEKGTIRKLFLGSRRAKLSKGRVVFTYDTIQSKIVSRVREFTTSDFCNAFSPPLILDKSVKEDIGYYFNPLLKWEEDYDFNKRVFENKVKIYWDRSAVIYHPPLSMKSDLRAAYNYGSGHGIGLNAGVFTDDSNRISKEQKKKNRKAQYKVIRKQKGICAFLYYVMWHKKYVKGVKKTYKNVKE